MKELKRIAPAEVSRDEYGFWTHPELPNFDESVEAFKVWVKEHNLSIITTQFEYDAPEELCDAWFENGICDCSSWDPSKPDGDGWFMLGIWDTEDGPVCSWAKHLPGYEDPTQNATIILRGVVNAINDWDGQGGAIGYMGAGEWAIETHNVSPTADELNALFLIVGVEPKKIVSNGRCRDCANAKDGREQGCKGPCYSCRRPVMSNFIRVNKPKGGAA